VSAGVNNGERRTLVRQFFFCAWLNWRTTVRRSPKPGSKITGEPNAHAIDPPHRHCIMLGDIRGTTTTTGLTVRACLDEGTYRKGHQVTREEWDKLNLELHVVCPYWNYTIRPTQ